MPRGSDSRRTLLPTARPDSYGHSWALAFFSETRAKEDLGRAHRSLSRVLAPGVLRPWFRPVAGVMSPPLLAAAQRLGLRPVTWTARAFDGGFLRVSRSRALARLRRGLVAGGILLMHDNPRSPGPEIVGALKEMADKEGLRFVTLSKLLRHPDDRDRDQA